MSRLAQRDLIDIASFTLDRWGDEQCRSYLSQLDARLHSLAIDPEQGRKANEVRPGYWRCHEGRHVIFYIVSSRHLDVVRVLHERMLPKRHL